MSRGSLSSNATTSFSNPLMQSGPKPDISEQGSGLKFINQTGFSPPVCLLLFLKGWNPHAEVRFKSLPIP